MNQATTTRRLQAFLRNPWFVPMLYTGATVVFGLIFPRLEHHLLPRLLSTVSAPAAMSVCSAIASGMIALTSIVFSLTFLMVQFSATAYSPRLVLWVARDPVVSHALGVFISTFLYALVMLGWVDRGVSGKVPLISSCLVIVLLVASMGMFIALIQRIALLQINRMLIFTGSQGRKSINELYGTRKAPSPASNLTDAQRNSVSQTLTYSGPPSVVQAIRPAILLALANKAEGVIEVQVAVGDAITEMTPLLRVLATTQTIDENSLRQAIEIGDERTFEQDPKYALRLIVDIAIKALSPAINDPTTAVQALDQIEDILIRLGRENLEIGIFHDRSGKLRLIVPTPNWEDFLHLGLGEIRHYGADSVQVMRRMKALIQHLSIILDPERRPALQHWEKRLQGSINRSFEEADERKAAAVADRQGVGLDKPATAGA